MNNTASYFCVMSLSVVLTICFSVWECYIHQTRRSAICMVTNIKSVLREHVLIQIFRFKLVCSLAVVTQTALVVRLKHMVNKFLLRIKGNCIVVMVTYDEVVLCSQMFLEHLGVYECVVDSAFTADVVDFCHVALIVAEGGYMCATVAKATCMEAMYVAVMEVSLLDSTL